MSRRFFGRREQGSDSAKSSPTSAPSLAPGPGAGLLFAPPQLPTSGEPRMAEGRLPPLPVSQPGDASERSADALASAVLSRAPPRGRTVSLPLPVAPASSGRGEPLDTRTRAYFEPRLGHDLGRVRVHTDAEAVGAATALRADAFTVGADITFQRGRYAPDTAAGRRLLAHELAHVVRHGEDGPRIHRQVPGGGSSGDAGGASREAASPATAAPNACQGPPRLNSIPATPLDAPAAPAAVSVEVEVRAPSLSEPGSRAAAQVRTERIAFQQPVSSSYPLTVYAVPLAVVQLGPEPDAPLLMCPPPGREREHLFTPSGAPPPVPASVAPPHAPPPAPEVGPSTPAVPPGISVERRVVYIGGEAHDVTLTDAYALTTRYTHLAVGAGATTLLETAEGVILIDAGVGSEGSRTDTATGDVRGAIADAIVARLRGVLNGRPIREVLLSHLHEDHTNLLPRLAREFTIESIRVNGLQLADPRFAVLRRQIADAQRERTLRLAEAEVEAGRTAWETSGPGAAIDPAERGAAFEALKASRVVAALEGMRPIRLDILVPSGGTLHRVEASVGDVGLPAGTPRDALPLERGLLDRGPTTGQPRVALSDPGLPERLAHRLAHPTEREPDTSIDTNSTSYVLTFPNGNRMLVLPDIRVADFNRLRQRLEGEFARLREQGLQPPVFQAWNMTHHMQAGWVANASQLEGFISTMHGLTHLPTLEGGRTAEMVVVSAQGNPANPAVRSMIDPAMVWLLRSMGMEVFLATSGRDIRLVEAITASGQPISGVAGTRYEGLRPHEALLRRSEAAIRHLRERATVEGSRLPARGGPLAERQRVRALQGQLETEARTIEARRRAYIEAINAELGRGPHAGPSAPAVAPAADAPVEPARARAQALRDALAIEHLSDLPATVTPEAPVLTETAMVLLRAQEGTPEGRAATEVMHAIERADALRAELRETNSPLTRARLASEVMNLREALTRQLEGASPPTRTLLNEELGLLGRELDALTASEGHSPTFSREPGTGRVVETRIIGGHPAEALPPSTLLVRKFAAGSGRVLGGVMLYQLIRSEGAQDARAEAGEVTGLERLVGMTHHALGVRVSVRMMTARPVGLGQFAILAALEVVETASAAYESNAQFATSVTYSAIRNGLSLGLIALGEAMMASRNPWLAAGGFAVMFVADPILEFFGVYDMLERAFEFLPSEVTRANQRMRDLLGEYQVLVGALELSGRSAENLRELGARQPEELLREARRLTAERRHQALDKEAEFLSALSEGYTRARTDYAGLIELDQLRDGFLDLRRRAHEGDTEWGTVSLERSDRALRAIHGGLSLDALSPEQVAAMPQWTALREALDAFEGRLGDTPPDWEALSQKQGEVDQMLRHAHYRLEPASGGRRSTPLLSPGTPTRARYEEVLAQHEARMAGLRHRMTQRLGAEPLCLPGQLPGAPAVGAQGPVMAPAGVLGGDVVLDRAENILHAYRALVRDPPSPLFAPEGQQGAVLARSSADLGTGYRRFIAEHEGYRAYLFRLRAAEGALMASVEEARRAHQATRGEPRTTVTGERLRRVLDEARAAVNDRREVRGLLFPDEAARGMQAVRAAENRDLARRLGEPEGTRPLSASEQAALATDDLDNYGREVSTVTNRLGAIPELRRPEGGRGRISGIYRLVGTFESIDLLIISIPQRTVAASENVLVGDLGPAGEVMTGAGHQQRRSVVPLNAAAVRLFGSNRPRPVLQGLLQPVNLEDIQP